MYIKKLEQLQDHVEDIIYCISPNKKIPKLKKFLQFIKEEQRILKEQYPDGVYPDDNNNESKTENQFQTGN